MCPCPSSKVRERTEFGSGRVKMLRYRCHGVTINCDWILVISLETKTLVDMTVQLDNSATADFPRDNSTYET
jgi:hypothetical protein